jgi:hypothetical protein
LPVYGTFGDNTNTITNAIEMNTIPRPNGNNDSSVAPSPPLIHRDTHNTSNAFMSPTIDIWIALASLGVAIMQFVQGILLLRNFGTGKFSLYFRLRH